jgi:hypothetical protein
VVFEWEEVFVGFLEGIKNVDPLGYFIALRELVS